MYIIKIKVIYGVRILWIIRTRVRINQRIRTQSFWVRIILGTNSPGYEISSNLFKPSKRVPWNLFLFVRMNTFVYYHSALLAHFPHEDKKIAEELRGAPRESPHNRNFEETVNLIVRLRVNEFQLYVWNKVILAERWAKKFIKSTIISARPNWLRSIDKRGNTIQSLSASNWVVTETGLFSLPDQYLS